MLKRLIIVAILSIPLMVWAFFKPVRILTPELAGVSCVTKLICIDNLSRFAEASILYQNSIGFVGRNVGNFSNQPRVIFCDTEACFRSFGFTRSSANAVGTFGIVISPRAWEEYYVRHEMIHHLQKEIIGNFKGAFITPNWFIEGMAYSLSDDPRPILPEPWQQYRSQFNTWYQHVGKERLWVEATKL